MAKDSVSNILKSTQIPTTTPTETLKAIVDWIQSLNVSISCIGAACFGPLCLNESLDQFGFITSTPKPGWQNTNIIGPLKNAFPGIPIGFDTDVNAAAVGELYNGDHGKGINSLAYITVGTGVGVGLVVEGNCVHGLIHPEMGHLRPPRHSNDRDFVGTCPFHGDCIEGLVSTIALCKRFEVDEKQLPTIADDHPSWNLVAFYLAHLCASIALTVSSQKIVISGGVMNRKSLFPLIRKHFNESLNGYLTAKELHSNFIVESKFGDKAGVIGGLELARQSFLK